MSWKGFTKGAARAPQQFRQKFNMGDITKDAIYIDAERRFAELETETKKLHEESSKYALSHDLAVIDNTDIAQILQCYQRHARPPNRVLQGLR